MNEKYQANVLESLDVFSLVQAENVECFIAYRDLVRKTPKQNS